MQSGSVSLSRLRLYNFRNYSKAEFSFQPGLNLIYGANGSGKTNIIEAVSRFYDSGGIKAVPAGAVTNAADREAGWSAKMYVQSDDLHYALQTGVTPYPENRAFLTVDDKKAGRAGVRNFFPCLWLLQEDERLFSDDRAKVRKFFNRAVASLYPDYGAACADYDAALRERLKILIAARFFPHKDAQLHALEQAIAESAFEMMRYRRYFLQDFALRYQAVAEILPEEPKFILSYHCLGETCKDGVEFAEKLCEHREIDAKAGRNLFGVHRVMWNAVREKDKCEALHCSAGEQKALMLKILCVIADLCCQSASAGGSLILADDFASRLDEKRQARFLSYFFHSGVQVILTGTEIPAYAARYDIQSFTPQSGVKETQNLRLFA